MFARTYSFHCGLRIPTFAKSFARNMVAIEDKAPSSIMVDFITFNSSTTEYDTQKEDFSNVLSKHKKSVLFAVPGAFTPTCSLTHTPGFIENAALIREKGVEAIYCLAVNDKYVMKAWAESLTGAKESGIIFVADGSAAFAKALQLTKDASESGMGIRYKRFAALLENGYFKVLQVDEKGVDKASAANLLTFL